MHDMITFRLENRTLKADGPIYSGETVAVKVPITDTSLTASDFKLVVYSRDKAVLAVSEPFAATWQTTINTATTAMADYFDTVKADAVKTLGIVIVNTSTADTIAHGILDVISVPFADELTPVPQILSFVTHDELDTILADYATSQTVEGYKLEVMGEIQSDRTRMDSMTLDISFLQSDKQDVIGFEGIVNGNGDGTVSALTVGTGLTYTNGTLSASAQAQTATRDILYSNAKAPVYTGYGTASQRQIGSLVEFAGWSRKASVWVEDITSTTINQYPGFVIGLYIEDAVAVGLPDDFSGFHSVFSYKSQIKSGQRKYATVCAVEGGGCIEIDDTATTDLSTGTFTLNFYAESFPWQSKSAKYTPLLTAQFDTAWTGTHPTSLSHPVEPFKGGVKYKTLSTDTAWTDSDIRTYYAYYLVPQIDEQLHTINSQIGDVETILNAL